mgnify:FL=1
MDVQLGALLLYGGLAGVVLFALAGLICWRVLRKKGRALLHAIETEYQ